MELWSLGKDPIQTEQPTGTDVQKDYDPEFEELDQEIKKLSSPSTSGSFSWQKVSDLGASILEKKSKHIMVASYLAVAQVHINKIEGLAAGTRIFCDLLEQFWNNLYPPKKRKKGRVQAITWWIEKTEIALEKIEPSPVPFEEMEQIKADLQKIDDLLVEYVGDDAPLIRPVQRALEKFPVEEPKSDKPAEESQPAEEPKTQPVAGSEASSSPREDEALQTEIIPETQHVKPLPVEQKKTEPITQQPASSPTITAKIKELEPLSIPNEALPEIDEKNIQSALRSGLQIVRKVAVYLREVNLASPQAYRYARIAVWTPVETLPQLKTGKNIERGTTQIMGPPAQTQKIFIDLRAKNDWKNIIKVAEQNLSRFIFWLDLNYFVAESFEKLGNEFQKAKDAVCQETAIFVHRLSGLETLLFSDSTPFANYETQQWLTSIGFQNKGSESKTIEKSSHDDNWMAEHFQKALSLSKANKLVEAVEYLQAEWKGNFSKRESLIWRLALSELLVNSKQANLALPHLEQILQEIEKYGLEEWDIELSLKCLKVIWAGFNVLPNESFKAKAEKILHRITKLNPAEAIRLRKI